MKRLAPSQFELSVVGSRSRPTTVRFICPVCEDQTRLRLEKKWEPGIVYDDSCPCGARLHFVLIEGSVATTDSSEWDGQLWLHPPGRPKREPIGVNGCQAIPDNLKREYHEAVDLFNQRSWRACAGACRVVVEGLARHITGQPNKMLGTLRSDLADHGLTGPIEQVIDVLHAGGNFASHYEADRTLTPAIAEQVLNMLDAWIEYVYLIPQQVRTTAKVLSDPNSYTDEPGEPRDSAAPEEDRTAALQEALSRRWPDVWRVQISATGKPAVTSTDYVRPSDDTINEILGLAADHGFPGIRIEDPKYGNALAP